MEIIFHIGMGKTGTSSIQRALADNADSLQAGGAYYLGMWFDILGEQFRGLSGTSRFLSSSPDQMKCLAETFHVKISELMASSGASKFILSNEAIFQSASNFLPFAKYLVGVEGVSVRLVAYVRPPADWISSAYSQWGINHKTSPGRIPSIGVFAQSLLSQYDASKIWMQEFGDQLCLRAYNKSEDVVLDFGGAVGVRIDPSSSKVLERKELAELILRREFNNSFSGEVLPKVYDDVVLGSLYPQVEELSSVVASMFASDSINEIIRGKSDLWMSIKENYGIDLVGENTDMLPDTQQLRDRLVDYLLVLVLRQAKRIYSLEVKLKDIREDSRA